MWNSGRAVEAVARGLSWIAVRRQSSCGLAQPFAGRIVPSGTRKRGCVAERTGRPIELIAGGRSTKRKRGANRGQHWQSKANTPTMQLTYLDEPICRENKDFQRKNTLFPIQSQLAWIRFKIQWPQGCVGSSPGCTTMQTGETSREKLRVYRDLLRL